MSTVPGAIDALVTIAGTVMSPEFVFDGVPEAWPDQDAFIVGGARDGSGVVVEANYAGLSPANNQEAVNVSCVIICVGGDVAVRPQRERAFGYYGSFVAAIRQSKTLNGSVVSVRISSTSVNQFLNESGAVVELAFIVSCLAYA